MVFTTGALLAHSFADVDYFSVCMAHSASVPDCRIHPRSCFYINWKYFFVSVQTVANPDLILCVFLDTVMRNLSLPVSVLEKHEA